MHLGDVHRGAGHIDTVVCCAMRNVFILLAMRLAEQGIRVKGHKLVRKKANRTWASDHVGVRTALIAGGLSSADFMSKPELMTPAQVERIGPEAKAIVNGIRCVDRSDTWEIPPLAVKGVGGLTLAHEDDPRAEVVVDVSADFPPEV